MDGSWPGPVWPLAWPWLALGLALGWPLAWPLAGPWPAWPWLALGLALAGPWPGPGWPLAWPWLAREHPKDHQCTMPSAGVRSLQNGSYDAPMDIPWSKWNFWHCHAERQWRVDSTQLPAQHKITSKKVSSPYSQNII